MKEKKDAEVAASQVANGAAVVQSKARTMVAERPDIPVLSAGTQVYVPRAREAECGPRGFVSEWNKQKRMYSVRWNAPNAAGIMKHSVVAHRDVYEYIEDCHGYPADAIQFDTSVRCGEGQELTPGIVQGVVLDNASQAPIYYNVGPNSTGSHMYYCADQVHVVAGAHGLDEDFSKRMYQVGAMILKQLDRKQTNQQPPGDAPIDAAAATPHSTLFSPAVASSSKAAHPAATTTKAPPKTATQLPPLPRSTPLSPAVASSSKTAHPAAHTHIDVRSSSSDSDSESSVSAPPGHAKSDSSSSSDSGSGSSASSSSPKPLPAPPPPPATKPRVKAAAKKTGAQGQAAQPTPSTPSTPGDKEQRASKFNYKHDDAVTHCIFMQLATNVPWSHSHRGQKAIWKLHLTALQDENHATELRGHKDAVKTFMAWAASICKARRTWRLAQAKKSGFAHATNDAVDDVAQKWETKVCGEAALSANNQERAMLMREVMTTTGAGIEVKAEKIAELRKKRYATVASQGETAEAKASTPPSKHPKLKSSVSQSPTEARTLLLHGIHAMTQGTAETDAAFVEDIVTRVVASLAPAQAPPQTADQSHVGDLHLLQLLLQQEDSSLVSWAPQIFHALGISATAHFTELSAADIMLAAGIPSMQKHRLITVGKRFGLLV